MLETVDAINGALFLLEVMQVSALEDGPTPVVVYDKLDGHEGKKDEGLVIVPVKACSCLPLWLVLS